MWHWNSLWASAPGEPPAVDDPVRWQSPWPAEQVMAMQARAMEAMVGTSHSWWTFMLSAWLVPQVDALAADESPHDAAKPAATPRAARPPRKRKSTAKRTH